MRVTNKERYYYESFDCGKTKRYRYSDVRAWHLNRNSKPNRKS